MFFDGLERTSTTVWER